MTDETSRELAKLVKVTHLDLRYCPLTNAGMARASQAMPRLEYCNVEGCRLTCLGIAALMRRHKNLRVWGPGEHPPQASNWDARPPMLSMCLSEMQGTCIVLPDKASLQTLSCHSSGDDQGGPLAAVACSCCQTGSISLAGIPTLHGLAVMACDGCSCPLQSRTTCTAS